MARGSNSVFQKNSRYVQGGLTDRFSNRLGWWERVIYQEQTDDVLTTVLPGEAARPMKIAYRVYNRDGLGWLVLQYNNIVDINEEIVVGAKLKLPSPGRVFLSMLGRPVGGKIV